MTGKISDIASLETTKSNIALIEGEKADGTSIKFTPSTLVGAGLVQIGSTITTSSNQTSATFSSIPATFKDLVLRILGRVSTSGTDIDALLLQLNGDTGSNYGYDRTGFFGTSGFGGTNTAQSAMQLAGLSAATSQSGFPGFSEITIPLYTSTTWKKVAISRSMATGSGAPTNHISSGYWNATAAVSSLLIKPTSTNYFIDGTIIELFGLG